MSDVATQTVTTPTTPATGTAPTTPATPPPATPAADGAAPAAAEKVPTAGDWARFAERTRKLDAERLALKTEREAWAAEREANKPKTLEAVKERLKTGESPLAVLAELGLSYQELTKAALRAGKKDPAAETQKLIDDALAKERGEREKGAKAEQEQQLAAAWQRIDSDFATLVNGGGETYELLRIELEEHPDVVRRTLRDLNELDRQQSLLEPDKRLPGYRPLSSIEDAARRYEDILVQQIERRASAAKIKARLNPSQQTPAEKGVTPSTATDESGTKASTGGPRTLTQAHAQSRSVPAPTSVEKPSDAVPVFGSPTERIAWEQEQDRKRLADAIAVLNKPKSAA